MNKYNYTHSHTVDTIQYAWHLKCTEDKINIITATAKIGCPMFIHPTGNYGRKVEIANGWYGLRIE